MNVLLVGLGGFGFGWLKNVLIKNENVRIIGLVDKNPDSLTKAKELDGIEENMLFLDIVEALDCLKPDFILNVTPPAIHKTVNLAAF